MRGRLPTMAITKRLAIQFSGTALFFSAFVSLTTSGVLLFASVLGYLPYSDRPGPGRWGVRIVHLWVKLGTTSASRHGSHISVYSSGLASSYSVLSWGLRPRRSGLLEPLVA